MRVTFLIPPCTTCGSAYLIGHPLREKSRFVRLNPGLLSYGRWCSECGACPLQAICNVLVGHHMMPTLVPR